MAPLAPFWTPVKTAGSKPFSTLNFLKKFGEYFETSSEVYFTPTTVGHLAFARLRAVSTLTSTEFMKGMW